VTFYGAQDRVRDIFSVIPVFLIPLLQHAYRLPCHLYIKLDILCNAGMRKVRRADQRGGADDSNRAWVMYAFA